MALAGLYLYFSPPSHLVTSSLTSFFPSPTHPSSLFIFLSLSFSLLSKYMKLGLMTVQFVAQISSQYWWAKVLRNTVRKGTSMSFLLESLPFSQFVHQTSDKGVQYLGQRTGSFKCICTRQPQKVHNNIFYEKNMGYNYPSIEFIKKFPNKPIPVEL